MLGNGEDEGGPVDDFVVADVAVALVGRGGKEGGREGGRVGR